MEKFFSKTTNNLRGKKTMEKMEKINREKVNTILYGLEDPGSPLHMMTDAFVLLRILRMSIFPNNMVSFKKGSYIEEAENPRTPEETWAAVLAGSSNSLKKTNPAMIQSMMWNNKTGFFIACARRNREISFLLLENMPEAICDGSGDTVATAFEKVLYYKDLTWAIDLMNLGAGYVSETKHVFNRYGTSFLFKILEGHSIFLDQKGLL